MGNGRLSWFIVFLHDFTLFVIDIHQIMLVSLFPTLFGHFQFLGSTGQNPNLILTLCHKSYWIDDDDEDYRAAGLSGLSVQDQQ